MFLPEWSFKICRSCSDVPSFIPDTGNLGILYYCPAHSKYRHIKFIGLKKSVSIFIYFLYCFPVFYFIDFCFIIFFLLPILGIIFSLSGFLMQKQRSLIYKLSFLIQEFQCYKVPSMNCFNCISHTLLSSVFIFIQFKAVSNFLFDFFFKPGVIQKYVDVVSKYLRISQISFSY